MESILVLKLVRSRQRNGCGCMKGENGEMLSVKEEKRKIVGEGLGVDG